MAAASKASGASDTGSSKNTDTTALMSKNDDTEKARKRRKEILASTRQNSDKRQRTSSSASSVESEPSNSSSTCLSSIDKQKQIKGKTKYQNRYDPEVPMSKQEAAEWRREARRKRNRESAAASRNKVRSRINELEAEVEEWKSKYSHLLERIARLESTTRSNPLITDPTAHVDVTAPGPSTVSPSGSPTPTPLSLALSLDSLPIDLSIPAWNNGTTNVDHPQGQLHQAPDRSLHTHTVHADADAAHEFHVIEMTSRPA